VAARLNETIFVLFKTGGHGVPPLQLFSGKTPLLEPAFFVLYVRSHKLLVGFREIHDSFDDPDDAHHNSGNATREHGDEQHDESLSRVAEDELVHTKTADEDREYSGYDFLIAAHRLPICDCSWINRLHWLITSAHGG